MTDTYDNMNESQNIMQSKRKKRPKKPTQNPRIYGLNPFIHNSRTGKTYLWLKKSDQWLPQRRVQGLTWKGHEATSWEDGDVLTLRGVH